MLLLSRVSTDQTCSGKGDLLPAHLLTDDQGDEEEPVETTEGEQEDGVEPEGEEGEKEEDHEQEAWAGEGGRAGGGENTCHCLLPGLVMREESAVPERTGVDGPGCPER